MEKSIGNNFRFSKRFFENAKYGPNGKNTWRKKAYSPQAIWEWKKRKTGRRTTLNTVHLPEVFRPWFFFRAEGIYAPSEYQVGYRMG